MAKPSGNAPAPQPMQERSRRTREMIIEGALAEFSTKGFDGARIDEIALRAGVNKNLLYHHFGSKDGLFTALLERMYETIRQRQDDLQIRSLDPVEALRKLVIFTGSVWVQHPEFLRLLQSENLNGGRHVKASEKISNMYNPLLATISDILERGVKQGLMRENLDPIDIYISITSLMAHYITNAHTFEAIFNRRLMTAERIKKRLEHAADMIERYVVRD
ncbi:conserved hypothetical protein [Burkholderiales bacterium 8X]|nr:conserved hypothetical protein [Burkholderiales bacterium 8X]